MLKKNSFKMANQLMIVLSHDSLSDFYLYIL